MKCIATLLAIASVTVATATDLTVVSFNIRNGGRRMNGTYDHAYQQQVLKNLKPDVVAMQEVDHFTKRAGNVDVAGDYGRALGMTSHFGAALPYGGGAYGAAVLSKLPVVADESLQLPVKGGEPRVCVIRFVKVGSGIVAIVGVHLDSAESSDAARLENAALILARVKSIKDPVIITGDFNDVADSATIKLFTDAGFRRLVPKGDARSFPADKPTVVIDHILVKNGEKAVIEDAGVEVAPVADASDHRPLVSHLKVK